MDIIGVEDQKQIDFARDIARDLERVRREAEQNRQMEDMSRRAAAEHEKYNTKK